MNPIGTLQAPTFSVIIPLYNKREYVARALQSVLAQDYADFEVIVVDDGSGDGSADVVRGVRDHRVTLVSQANAGPGAARNTGIAYATGEWIAFLDADDAWWPSHLSELRRIATAFPNARLIATSFRETHSDSLPAKVDGGEDRLRAIDYFVEAAQRIGVVNSSCAAIRSDVPKQVGGFSHHKTGEDLEYWARIALRYEVALSDRVTSAYFRGVGGVMDHVRNPDRPEMPTPTLPELSPSVGMLCERARSEPALWANHSVRRYVNARLEVTVAGSLYEGRYRTARGFARLFIPPLTFRQQVYRTLAALPRTAQKALVGLYRGSAPLARRARSLSRGISSASLPPKA